MVGQTVGKYRVVSRLGRGGMGTVYKAVDETLDREVAIKCLNAELGDQELMKRFRAEAIALARLNHPNIATLFELTEHEGQLLMVMEFVRGETFESLSHRLGPLPVDRAAQLCSQVLDALGHAHGAGIVHRDLKPANLMLTESGLTKVMDFGLARMAGTEHLTNDGFMVGTPAYMAPEQVLGRDIDGRADLYAMGVVLFRLLTAQLPFKADSSIAMVQKQLHDEPTPVRQFRMELPVVCDEIVGRALAKAPHDRFQTAEDFRTALVALGGPASSIAASPSAATPSMLQRAITTDPGSEPTLPATLSPVATAQPAPAAAPPHESAPTLVIPAPRRRNVAATAAIGVILLAGVPTAIVVWRQRDTNPPVTAPASVPVVPNPAASAPPAPDATTKSGAPRKTEAAAPGRPAAGAPGAAASRRSLPIVTFGQMKTLVLENGKSRDRDASLRFETDVLQVLDGQKTIQSASYRDIIGIFHSHSREPRWAAPDGTAVPVLKVGGKFSFLKGVPDWITVRTKSAFIPLRVQETELARVIAELETRTGTKIVRTR
jgi:serine/threonine-protein kinase